MTLACNQFDVATNRREMLRKSACGMAHIGLISMLAQQSTATAAFSETIDVRKSSHFRPKAKRVIFLFMWGGPSHVDLFDPKPKLKDLEGKPLTSEMIGGKHAPGGPLMPSPFRFSQYGEGGVWISELFPELAKNHSDRLCIVRSMHTNGTAHGEALLNLHTGTSNLVRPSVGAWVSYGLGSESENLPAFITISPPRGHGGIQNYGSAFLPAMHQGLAIGAAEIPIQKAKISNIGNSKIDLETQQEQLNLIQAINRQHLATAGRDAGIEGLISSYEMAFRMQSQIPTIMTLEDETSETLELYGVDKEPTNNFARQCLLARKLSERGVRYIQVSTDYTWDHHQKNNKELPKECARVDRPISGLLTDLARRGLLEDTLVVWGAEFGRTPTAENSDGRNHHPSAFSIWMAGGGTRGGFTYGSTDEFGCHPLENPMHMHDFHATLLYALGVDHKRLTYRHSGRDFRLTDVFGEVRSELFS